MPKSPTDPPASKTKRVPRASPRSRTRRNKPGRTTKPKEKAALPRRRSGTKVLAPPTPAPVGRILGEAIALTPGFGFGATAGRAPVLLTGKHQSAGGADDTLVRGAPGSHGVVIASTGAGKFVNCVAPAVLDHRGPLVVFDMKGEITHVTARERRRQGPTFTLDPFNVLRRDHSDSLNPFELMRLSGHCPIAEAQMLADDLAEGHQSQRDPYWVNAGKGLLGGLIAHFADQDDPEKGTLGAVSKLLHSPDVCDRLACMLEMDEITNPFAREAVGAFVEIPSGTGVSTRSAVLSFARNFMSFANSPAVQRSLGPTSFDIGDLLTGETPMTIYVVFPASKVHSHGPLLRLWASCLCKVLSARLQIPSQKTLMVMDEAAHFGGLNLLPLMYSYARGQGVTMLTLWQSLGQLMSAYPNDWRTIIENSGVIQAFGLHPTAIEPVAQLLGTHPELLQGLAPDEQLVLDGGQPARVLRKVDYRTHPFFKQFKIDPNPLYAGLNDPPQAPEGPAAAPGS